MAKSNFPNLTWDHLVNCLPPPHLYEVRSLIGDDIIDQTLELKSEVILFLELVTENTSTTNSLSFAKLHPQTFSESADNIDRFVRLYLDNANKKSKQKPHNKAFRQSKDELELENSIKSIRGGLLKEVSVLEKFSQDIQNYLLKNFSISDYKDEEEVIHPCQVNSPLSKSTNDCNKTGAKKQMQELSCGLEFLLTQNPDNKVVPNSVSTSSTSLNSPSTGTSSSSPDRAILKFETDLAPVHRNPSYPAKKQKIRSEKERDSLHHSDAIHKPTNIRKLSGSKGSKTKESIHLNETTRTPDGAIEKSGELVSLPSILNSSTHRSSKQLNKLQHSFPFNNNSNNNNNNKRTLLPSNSNESLIGINGNRNCHNCSRYNSAQRFRQMILKARQESGNC